MNQTPIEKYFVDGIPVFVKREDLLFSLPAPPFSKIRGLLPCLEKLKVQGIENVGYVETSISMAGWGVSWACKELQMHAVIFDPQYKTPIDVLLFHREQWKKLNAEIVPIKAGMAAVNWHICNKVMKARAQSILLPLGLPLQETIDNTAQEVAETLENGRYSSIVCCVGSGTILSGILKGSQEAAIDIHGIMTRTGNVKNKKAKIYHKANLFYSGFLGAENTLFLYDPGWEYSKKSNISCPFPTHAYYDLKAWEWLVNNIHKLAQPILFWNIGH